MALKLFLNPFPLNDFRNGARSKITYFNNHLWQMDYAQFQQKTYPIGSGVTEAACKTLIKQRLCCSGMRWKEKGASIILSLRVTTQAGDLGRKGCQETLV